MTVSDAFSGVNRTRPFVIRVTRLGFGLTPNAGVKVLKSIVGMCPSTDIRGGDALVLRKAGKILDEEEPWALIFDAKNDKVNLSQAEPNELKKPVPEFVQEYLKRKKP